MAVNQLKESDDKLTLVERVAKFDFWKILKLFRKSLFDIDKLRKVRCSARETHKGEIY